MKIKVFIPNINGKIEFTPAELEKLLNDTYEEGQRNCNCGSKLTWTSPYISPYVSPTIRETITSADSNTSNTSNTSTPETHFVTTLNATDVKEMSKHINEIVKNASAKIDNDAFSKLVRELNF